MCVCVCEGWGLKFPLQVAREVQVELLSREQRGLRRTLAGWRTRQRATSPYRQYENFRNRRAGSLVATEVVIVAFFFRGTKLEYGCIESVRKCFGVYPTSTLPRSCGVVGDIATLHYM